MGLSARIAVLASVLAVPLILSAQAPISPPADVQLQAADRLAANARFRDAADAYRHAAGALDADVPLKRRAHAGIALMLLRIGDFPAARAEAEGIVEGPPNAAFLSLYGDTLWAYGLFEEAEASYERAVAINPDEARGHHGRARVLTARTRLAEAMVEAREAVRLAPRDPEIHHTVGVIFERQHRFSEAATEFGRYLALLPNRDHTEKAIWARAEVQFLDSFHGRTPIDIVGPDTRQSWTVPIRIERDKVLVAVSVNGGAVSDFVLDTGAEHTVVSLELARQRRVAPIAYVPTAGVGDVGLRGLQSGRIDLLQVGELKIRNVPCLIKNPPLSDLPTREAESISPVALGLSMRIDYTRRELTIAREFPEVQYQTSLPLRMYRLATVRGVVNGQPATFVVDTGGEVISISQATAGQVPVAGAYRRIPLKVYGTSGWDKDAFLMPNVDLEFNSIRFSKIPVVVLNLKAPSALLGFQLGGIVGHKFLSQYRVSIDLARSLVGLDSN